MNTHTITDDVASAITRLRFLEQKSRDDDALITLLMQQKDDLAQELADAEHNHSVEMFKAQTERDAAVKRANDVRDIINKLGATCAEGLRRIKEDGNEVEHPATDAPRIVKHAVAEEHHTADKLEPPSFLRREPQGDEVRMPITAGDERLPGYRQGYLR